MGAKFGPKRLMLKRTADSLVSVQRTVTLRIASAYRTVFAPAVLVIAGTIPVDLLAVEQVEI